MDSRNLSGCHSQFIRSNTNRTTCQSLFGGKAPAFVQDNVSVVIVEGSAWSWVKDLID